MFGARLLKEAQSTGLLFDKKLSHHVISMVNIFSLNDHLFAVYLEPKPGLGFDPLLLSCLKGLYAALEEILGQLRSYYKSSTLDRYAYICMKHDDLRGRGVPSGKYNLQDSPSTIVRAFQRQLENLLNSFEDLKIGKSLLFYITVFHPIHMKAIREREKNILSRQRRKVLGNVGSLEDDLPFCHKYPFMLPVPQGFDGGLDTDKKAFSGYCLIVAMILACYHQKGFLEDNLNFLPPKRKKLNKERNKFWDDFKTYKEKYHVMKHLYNKENIEKQESAGRAILDEMNLLFEKFPHLKNKQAQNYASVLPCLCTYYNVNCLVRTSDGFDEVKYSSNGKGFDPTKPIVNLHRFNDHMAAIRSFKEYKKKFRFQCSWCRKPCGSAKFGHLCNFSISKLPQCRQCKRYFQQESTFKDCNTSYYFCDSSLSANLALECEQCDQLFFSKGEFFINEFLPLAEGALIFFLFFRLQNET